jgi:hypothetical protein
MFDCPRLAGGIALTGSLMVAAARRTEFSLTNEPLTRFQLANVRVTSFLQIS